VAPSGCLGQLGAVTRATRPLPTGTPGRAYTNRLCPYPLAETDFLLRQRRCAAALAKRLASHTGQSPMRLVQSPLSTPSRPNSGRSFMSASCQERTSARVSWLRAVDDRSPPCVITGRERYSLLCTTSVRQSPAIFNIFKLPPAGDKQLLDIGVESGDLDNDPSPGGVDIGQHPPRSFDRLVGT
jgi:hypothetical protein